jgi:hypothetical protein
MCRHDESKAVPPLKDALLAPSRRTNALAAEVLPTTPLPRAITGVLFDVFATTKQRVSFAAAALTQTLIV